MVMSWVVRIAATLSKGGGAYQRFLLIAYAEGAL